MVRLAEVVSEAEEPLMTIILQDDDYRCNIRFLFSPAGGRAAFPLYHHSRIDLPFGIGDVPTAIGRANKTWCPRIFQ